MSEPSNAQREAVIRLMAEVWDDFVSDTGCFPDDFTILPRRRLQFVAGRWSGMVADALYGPNGPITTALAEAEARGRRQGLEEAVDACAGITGGLQLATAIWNRRDATNPAETQKPKETA
jgi:hypothetical protein